MPFCELCRLKKLRKLYNTKFHHRHHAGETKKIPFTQYIYITCVKYNVYTPNYFYFMIEYIKGELAEVTPAYAVVEAHGVGYGMNISLNTYSNIQTKKEVKLYVFESIREDAYALFGFSSRQEREMFTLLISVSGVGANTARMILSALSPAELCNVISTGNEKLLKTVKGIGLRTAQRIIVDLKDKIATADFGGEISIGGATAQVAAVNKEVHDEAIGALTMLGFAPAPSAKVVSAILKDSPELPVEQVVKLALKQIK